MPQELSSDTPHPPWTNEIRLTPHTHTLHLLPRRSRAVPPFRRLLWFLGRQVLLLSAQNGLGTISRGDLLCSNVRAGKQLVLSSD